MGSNETYFKKEIIKTHLTVILKNNYITHFFRQFVALKKSRRQFKLLFTPGWGVCEGLGMDKIMGFYISSGLMFSITFVSVMHFHDHLCISISPEILKEFFAYISSFNFHIITVQGWGNVNDLEEDNYF